MKSFIVCLLIGGTLIGCSKSKVVGDDALRPGDSNKVGDVEVEKHIGVYITSADENKKMLKEANIGFNTGSSANPEIIIDPAQQFQSIDGCGIALTGSSAYMLMQLLPGERTSLLKELFEVGNSVSLSIVRITIGASDFSTTAYTYDDMPPGQTDGGLNNFNLYKHDDLNYVIPVLEEILSINSEIKILASPWSPPAWMKRSGSLNATNETDNYQNSLMDGYRSVWSNYLVKYLEALKNHSPSIPVWALTVQNEPRTLKTSYPTSYMTVANQQFIIKDLRTKMNASGLNSVKIFCGDNNWAGSSYVTGFYEDQLAKNAVAGAAFHGYTDENSGGSSDVMTPIYHADTTKELHVTEYSGNRRDGFASELKSFTLTRMIYPFRNWARSVTYWNLALNENRRPNIKIGGTDSRPAITIDSASHAITRNVDYYVLAHVSKFLRRGAKRIHSTSITASNIHNVAFLNPDGWKTLVVYNSATAPRAVDVKIGTDKFTYSIPQNSTVTFNWK